MKIKSSKIFYLSLNLPEPLNNFLDTHFPPLITFLGYLLGIFFLYRVLSFTVNTAHNRGILKPHMENLVRLVLRVTAIFSGILAAFNVYNLPLSWFLGSSAFLGAILGFGSSQTINNVIAGFYVIFSKPFEVKDYVKIGEVEGQVEEISINYTKIYTPTFNLLQIPNVQVLNSRVLNCTHEGFIKNTFIFTVPHAVPFKNDELVEKCFKPAIEEISEKYPKVLLRKPEVYFEISTHFGRGFKVRVFLPKGQARTMYVIQSELSNRFLQLFDELRLPLVPTN